jgi:hypothetical protein
MGGKPAIETDASKESPNRTGFHALSGASEPVVRRFHEAAVNDVPKPGQIAGKAVLSAKGSTQRFKEVLAKRGIAQ